MKSIHLKILASDVLESKFYNSLDCAVTRALHRTGLKEYRHTGLTIRANGPIWNEQKVLCDIFNSNLGDLNDKIFLAYERRMTAQDFEFILLLYDTKSVDTGGV